MPPSLPIVAASAGLLYVLWRLFRNYFISYSVDNLPHPPSKSLLFGVLPEITGRQSWRTWAQWADTYGPAFIVQSVLGMRMVVIHDPKALHTMMVKDQESFPKGLEPSNDLHLLLGPGILTTEGEQHRRQRKLLNPVFSAAHLRNMTHIFYNVAHDVAQAIGKRLPASAVAEELDVNGWMARTTLEMLGQAGLGYSFDNFLDDSTDDYGESLKLFFPTLSHLFPIFGLVVQNVSWYLPDSISRSLLRFSSNKRITKLMSIYDTMERRSREIIMEKKALLAKGDAALAHEVGEGKDIMSICLKSNMAAADNEKMTDDEIQAQMSTFILAGMDTTSNALSRIFHLLAENPDVQEKLRAEIIEAQGGDRSDIAYDDLVKLPYLDAVCRETLRVYAPVMMSGRTAAKETVLPLSHPVRGTDGREFTELIIPRGMLVLTHYQASNVNEELWGEDAKEWKPERWLSPLPTVLENARIPGVYAHLMTFAAGTRSCIGFKFSQLEMKVVLSVLLPVFAFEVTDKAIAWNASAVGYPTMGEESEKPELLLKVKALKA